MSHIRHPVDGALVDAASLWPAGLICFMGFTEKDVLRATWRAK
jgi:hypothetical protein